MGISKKTKKGCINICDRERGQLISFRVEGLKQRPKKLYFTKMTIMGVGVMVLGKMEMMVVRGWGEFCPQMWVSGERSISGKVCSRGQSSEMESWSGSVGPGLEDLCLSPRSICVTLDK